MGRKKSMLAKIKEKLTGGGDGETRKSRKARARASSPGFHEDDSEKRLMEKELKHELKLAFDLYSKGLTSIPCREIGYILRTLGQNPTEDDIINLVCEAGCSWDGYLTRDDFVGVGVVAMQKQANRLDDVKAAFRAFDHNNDGIISREELRDAMTRYGHTFTVEECDEMFQEADVNNDGMIDFDEFVAMMMTDHIQVNYSNPEPDFGHGNQYAQVNKR